MGYISAFKWLINAKYTYDVKLYCVRGIIVVTVTQQYVPFLLVSGMYESE
jgi:hypothetical protein